MELFHQKKLQIGLRQLDTNYRHDNFIVLYIAKTEDKRFYVISIMYSGRKICEQFKETDT